MSKKKPQLTPEQLIQRVKDRCIEIGDCWIWQGALTAGTVPNMHHPNRARKSAISPRAIILEALGKESPNPKWWASNTCNDRLCVSPEHAAWRSRIGKFRDLGRQGVWSGKELTMKKARIHQANSPLDWDKVRDIRSRTDNVTYKELAKEFGVDPTTISKVRRHLSWIEYRANPFAGLFTGLAANDAGKRRA